MLLSSGEMTPPCGVPFSLFPDPCLQPFGDQAAYHSILTPRPRQFLHLSVIDSVEDTCVKPPPARLPLGGKKSMFLKEISIIIKVWRQRERGQKYCDRLWRNHGL